MPWLRSPRKPATPIVKAPGHGLSAPSVRGALASGPSKSVSRVPEGDTRVAASWLGTTDCMLRVTSTRSTTRFSATVAETESDCPVPLGSAAEGADETPCALAQLAEALVPPIQPSASRTAAAASIRP